MVRTASIVALWLAIGVAPPVRSASKPRGLRAACLAFQHNALAEHWRDLAMFRLAWIAGQYLGGRPAAVDVSDVVSLRKALDAVAPHCTNDTVGLPHYPGACPGTYTYGDPAIWCAAVPLRDDILAWALANAAPEVAREVVVTPSSGVFGGDGVPSYDDVTSLTRPVLHRLARSLEPAVLAADADFQSTFSSVAVLAAALLAINRVGVDLWAYADLGREERYHPTTIHAYVRLLRHFPGATLVSAGIRAGRLSRKTVTRGCVVDHRVFGRELVGYVKFKPRDGPFCVVRTYKLYQPLIGQQWTRRRREPLRFEPARLDSFRWSGVRFEVCELARR